MDADTAGIGVNGLPPEKASKHKNPFLILLPAVIVIGVIIVALPLIFNYLNSQKAKPVALKQQGPSPDQQRRAMEWSVKSGFTGSQDKNIISFVNLASEEKDPAKKYDYYIKAFSNMVSNYKLTKPGSGQQAKEKEALLALKSYAGTLPGYKESDFVISK